VSERPIQVMLMDDHNVVREGLRALLERQTDIRVVAEAGTVAEAEAAEAEPDVVVADLVLPDERGAEVVRRLRERFPRSAILVLTMVDNPTDVQMCLAAGAKGYLMKEAAGAELTDAVRAVAQGREYLQPALGAVLARWREAPGKIGAKATADLGEREREVLRLIALGHTNAEIARLLFLSVRTVENHRASLMRKLGVRTRADLVRHATQSGLV
jgi:two-component system, NarL family, response regulator NreC